MQSARARTAISCRSRWLRLPGLCAIFLAASCQAQNLVLQPEKGTWLAVSNQTLDQLRGGFDMAPGLTVSFGVSRAVLVNGQLLTTTSFQVDDLAKFTSAQNRLAGGQPGLTPQVLQNGPGNTIAAGAMGIPLGIYVQNTLNQQTIHSETVIQTASSGLSMVKSLNLQSTLSESIHNAIGNR